MKTPLSLDPNIDKPDDFYEALITAHNGLTDAESARFNARLILFLANHIGDTEVLAEALIRAAETGRKP